MGAAACEQHTPCPAKGLVKVKSDDIRLPGWECLSTDFSLAPRSPRRTPIWKRLCTNRYPKGDTHTGTSFSIGAAEHPTKSPQSRITVTRTSFNLTRTWAALALG
jgi:hypothetical protein